MLWETIDQILLTPLRLSLENALHFFLLQENQRFPPQIFGLKIFNFVFIFGP